MRSHVITAAEAPCLSVQPNGGSDRYGAQAASLGAPVGLTGLGVTDMIFAPGKRTVPLPNHLGSDELCVILEGEGTHRSGDNEHLVAAGDICAAPKGGPGTAHRIINAGTAPLCDPGIRTRQDPGILDCSDSGEFGPIGNIPGQDFFAAHLTHIARCEGGLEFWDDADTGTPGDVKR